MSRYCIATFDSNKRVLDNRDDISWASACGIIGNAAEDDDGIDYAIVRRKSDSRIVLRYSREGDKR
jgi:hypothetical protein